MSNTGERLAVLRARLTLNESVDSGQVKPRNRSTDSGYKTGNNSAENIQETDHQTAEEGKKWTEICRNSVVHSVESAEYLKYFSRLNDFNVKHIHATQRYGFPRYFVCQNSEFLSKIHFFFKNQFLYQKSIFFVKHFFIFFFRFLMNYALLPLIEPTDGSKSAKIISRISDLILKYPTVLAFHLIIFEIHRQRGDRENVSTKSVVKK